MVKRKHMSTHYFQCDWTGLPMEGPGCYVPEEDEKGKLLRKGNYINWESVVAHRPELRERVKSIVGVEVEPAPHYFELTHFGGNMTSEGFLNACSWDKSAPCVEINLHNQILDANINELYSVSPRRDVCRLLNENTKLRVTMLDKTNRVNELATKLLQGVVIKGPVIIEMLKRDPSPKDRWRCVPLTVEAVTSMLADKKKKKKKGAVDEAQGEADAFAENLAKESAVPESLIPKAKVPPPNAKELAELARARGLSPGQRTGSESQAATPEPPPLSRQDATREPIACEA